MIRSRDAATDVLSSLPVIACCIVSVMMLLGVFAQTMIAGSGDANENALLEECRRILSAALDHLTSEAQDGRRYIAHDWEDRLKDIDFEPRARVDASAELEVRLFDRDSCAYSLAGNISACREVRSASEPVIIVESGRLSPGEIIVRVGR